MSNLHQCSKEPGFGCTLYCGMEFPTFSLAFSEIREIFQASLLLLRCRKIVFAPSLCAEELFSITWFQLHWFCDYDSSCPQICFCLILLLCLLSRFGIFRRKKVEELVHILCMPFDSDHSIALRGCCNAWYSIANPLFEGDSGFTCSTKYKRVGSVKDFSREGIFGGRPSFADSKPKGRTNVLPSPLELSIFFQMNRFTKGRVLLCLQVLLYHNCCFCCFSVMRMPAVHTVLTRIALPGRVSVFIHLFRWAIFKMFWEIPKIF